MLESQSRGWTHCVRLAIISALASPTLLAAQDQPVAFVHGFYADSTGWKPLTEVLRTKFEITPVVPDLNWSRRSADQFTTLGAVLADKPMMPAVGHSNGGAITRGYVQNSSNNRVNRLLTANSPHRGSSLAGNIADGRVKSWIRGTADAVLTPLAQLIPNPAISRPLRAGMNAFVFTYTEKWDLLNAPVLHDLRVGSAYMQSLEANRGVEQARVYSRVGISTSVSPSGVMCRGLFAGGASRTCRRGMRAAQVLYVGVGVYAKFTGRWSLGNSFLNGAVRLKRMDSDWLRFLGAGGNFNGYNGGPDATDGILSYSTQQYPGATRMIEMPHVLGFSISHQEANDRIDPIVKAYSDVFVKDFSIKDRGSSGGGDEPPPGGGDCSDPTVLVC